MQPFFLLEPGDGLVLCGANGQVSHVDRTAMHRLGHQSQEWCGQFIRDCWPQLADLIFQEHRRLTEGPRDHVLPLPHPTGVELATRIRLFACDSGFGVGVLRRRAQRLDASPEETNEDAYRRLLEGVLDTAQDAVLVTLAEPLDAPGPVIVYANQSLLEQTGYALHEVLGRSPRLFQGPETSRDSTAALRAAMDQWKPATMQVINYRRDQSTCWIELKVSPLADSTGWYTHWVSVQRDVTDRVLLERQLAQEARALADKLDTKQEVTGLNADLSP
ncbi:PAS domain-containing protein [Synechococcus sp. A10-1-5-1]|uniref:PAS domain-containing protein n=1 Tax=Synechococcus sp. A10-1-5-1 TaxID=2936507 RepID=UPI0020016E8C|nr:PAS domain-containing protein [Synechococcus sp. A10-1-5-1]UPM50581.1 PAS domain-containing protein [Synechococcus sp. A10-1-5-1]